MKSMTGYGRDEFKYKTRKITLEVKTVNHRFCEVNVRLPSRYYSLESEISEFTKKAFNRGRIDLFIRESGSSVRGKTKIDEAQIDLYLKILKNLGRKLKFNEPLRPEALLTLPQVIVQEEEEEDLKEAMLFLKKNLSGVFAKVEKMREKEGSEVKKEFLKRLEIISEHVSNVETKIPEMVKNYESRLKERIQKLTQQNPDEWRLAQEIAYFVDRTDISEEIQRLKAHMKHFKEVLNEKGTVGRKLDFILQEMNREVNTLGAKVQEIEVSKGVVACKHELEKMREQVQNVE